ncbi:MAG: histidine triad nucleotide-binding protein [Tissierellales bacterium]|nr:histidine triad nucleotide-binding protein [Tissierellales bacterium]MBN2827028.1 histidine triad nucleotide-binding protein [Tissierellales bacterium]
MNECLFCKIANKEIPSTIVYENDYVIAFEDISPEAPVHVLVIPKKHIASLNDINIENSVYIAKIFEAISIISREQGINETGYRIVSNCGKDAMQTVEHVHFHLLGKRSLKWPPG